MADDSRTDDSITEFETLIAGFRRFRLGSYRQQRERYDRLAHEGQSPRLMIIACSDSRTDPSLVFDTAPGQVFVLRNIANLVPPYAAIEGQSSVAAALEYAVSQLHVEYIVVFGHGRCGGIAAALAGDFDNPVAGQHIHAWMEFIAPARDAIKAAAVLSPDIDAPRALEQAAVRISIDNLRSYPFVAEAERAGHLHLEGCLFDIAEGSLKVLDWASGQFQPVSVEL